MHNEIKTSEIKETKSHESEELKKALLVSYNKILEHNSLPPEEMLKELEELSKYSHRFSSIWFTAPFMDYLINAMDKCIPSKYMQALGYMTTILKRWTHTLSEPPRELNSTERQHLIMVIHLLTKNLSNTDNEWIPIQNDALVALVALIGRSPEIYSETKLLENMARIFELYSSTGDFERAMLMSFTINAAVGYSLSKTTALNEPQVSSCQKLLESYIQFATLLLREEGPYAIMQVLEYSVDVRSQQKPQTQAEADLSALTQIGIQVAQHPVKMPSKCLAQLAGLAGIVRSLQVNKHKNTKKVIKLRRHAERIFIQQFDAAVSMTMLPEYVYELNTNQDTVSLLSSHCLMQISDKNIKKMNISNIVKILGATLFDSKYTFQGGAIIHKLQNTSAILYEVNDLIEHDLFKDIGRISRIMSKLIFILYTQKDYNTICQLMDRLAGFSYNIFVDWDRFVFDHSSINMNTQESQNYTDLTTAVWSVLKSIVFSSIVLLQVAAVDIPNGSGLTLIQGAAHNIISTFSNLSFITENLGQGVSHNIYEQIMTNTVSYLLNYNNTSLLNEIISQAFKEYAPPLFISGKQETIDVLSMVKQSRLLFYTDLSEQIMKNIDNQVIENDILPVLYPILKWRRIENKSLYESAHSAVISIFISAKPVCDGLAGIYANILIENFPEPISLNQLRYGFTTLTQSLCKIDEALAWLTVNQLITKIDSLKTKKYIILHSQYLIVLIDLLKPLSLSPFFSIMLEHIQDLILAQPTKIMQKATMKILFETISGFDISDLRKTEAISWYLTLKSKI